MGNRDNRIVLPRTYINRGNNNLSFIESCYPVDIEAADGNATSPFILRAEKVPTRIAHSISGGIKGVLEVGNGNIHIYGLNKIYNLNSVGDITEIFTKTDGDFEGEDMVIIRGQRYVLISDSSNSWYYDFTSDDITLTSTGIGVVELGDYYNGRFFVKTDTSSLNDSTFRYSSLNLGVENPGSWEGFDVIASRSSPDPITNIMSYGDSLFIGGTKSIDIWSHQVALEGVPVALIRSIKTGMYQSIKKFDFLVFVGDGGVINVFDTENGGVRVISPDNLRVKKTDTIWAYRDGRTIHIRVGKYVFEVFGSSWRLTSNLLEGMDYCADVESPTIETQTYFFTKRGSIYRLSDNKISRTKLVFQPMATDDSRHIGIASISLYTEDDLPDANATLYYTTNKGISWIEKQTVKTNTKGRYLWTSFGISRNFTFMIRTENIKEIHDCQIAEIY